MLERPAVAASTACTGTNTPIVPPAIERPSAASHMKEKHCSTAQQILRPVRYCLPEVELVMARAIGRCIKRSV